MVQEFDHIESPGAAHMTVGGRQILNFGGTPYLGLSNHPALVQAGCGALKSFGATGQLPRHYGFVAPSNADVEAEACLFFGSEAAMYYATGYLFGLMSMTALIDDYDVVLIDESAHYNLVEGARAAQKPIHMFKHRDADDLERVMAEVTSGGARPLVATDGMFATFGTIPPLARYKKIVDRHDGWLLIDESHSFGSVGATGRGACEHCGVAGERVVAGGSLAKAFCAYGGLTIASADVIAKMWKTPTARGAASGMTAGAAMTAASMRHIRAHPEILENLRANTAHLDRTLARLRVEPLETPSSVRAFNIGDADKMKAVQQGLWSDGIFIIYSTYVGAGPDGALRIAAFADHEAESFERLFEGLQKHL